MDAGHRWNPGEPDAFTADLLERCTFPPAGVAVDVAVSGGADSSALLLLAVAAGLLVTAHHVDHGLRPGGEAEGAVVVALARRWGAAAVTHRDEVDDGADLEARLRAARLGVLPPGTLMGHTADDLAETVLMRIMRGTGPGGLNPMDHATHPLLGLRRTETVALCRHLGIEPFVDPTNADPRFTRNRVRSEVIPLLDEVARRDVVPLLCRLADLAGRAAAAESTGGVEDPTDVRALREAPPAEVRRILRTWWREVTGLLPPDAAATERMVDVVQGRARGAEVSRGWRLTRRAGRLTLMPPGAGEPDRTSAVGR